MKKKLLITSALVIMSLSQPVGAVYGETNELIITSKNSQPVIIDKMQTISNGYPGMMWQETFNISNKSKQTTFKAIVKISPDSLYSDSLAGRMTIKQDGRQTRYSLKDNYKGIDLTIPKGGSVNVITDLQLDGDKIGNADQGQTGKVSYQFIIQEGPDQQKGTQKEKEHSKDSPAILPKMSTLKEWPLIIIGIIVLVIGCKIWLNKLRRRSY